MSDNNLMKVTVQNASDVLFEGTADRITSFNEVGRFDVYPMHANFISIMGKELVIYEKSRKVKELTFEQAVIKVKRDVVSIFLGIEVLLLENSS